MFVLEKTEKKKIKYREKSTFAIINFKINIY